jgi:hypothetical protein
VSIDEGGTSPSSGQGTKRTSARAANASNAMELIKKATKSVKKLRSPTALTKDSKLALATFLEDIIENLKQPRITTARIETSEAETQTHKPDETQIDIEKTQLDEIQESIADLMALTTANTTKVNDLKHNVTTSCAKHGNIGQPQRRNYQRGRRRKNVGSNRRDYQTSNPPTSRQPPKERTDLKSP